jgi:hypothetical protein
MRGIPRHPNPPPPPPCRVMKHGWYGIYETPESKQARADWYASMDRPAPVEYTESEGMTASYVFKRLAFLSFGVAFAVFMAYR